jgi:hypothetical protein
MDASSLEREINRLEIRSDSLDAWLLFWIILVVVGLVVEVCVVVKEHWHKPEKRTIWTFLLELIGPLLITIGVAGELGIHIKAGHVETALRNANRNVFALLNKEAGTARKEAGDAIKAVNLKRGKSLEKGVIIGEVEPCLTHSFPRCFPEIDTRQRERRRIQVN